jgi:hypothetical protein
MQQANDFREESLTLKALIEDLDDGAFEAVTQFKGWTINDVFRHLHFWNKAVMVASQGEEAFGEFFQGVGAHMTKGGSLPEYEKLYLEGLSGGALRSAWSDLVDETAECVCRHGSKCSCALGGSKYECTFVYLCSADGDLGARARGL